MTSYLQGPSREQLSQARDAFAGRLEGLDVEAATRLSDDLYGVAALLHREPALRRAVADPSLPGERRADLARAVVGDRLSEPARETLADLVARRWSSPRDLIEVADRLAARAAFAAAEQSGDLDGVEDDLFRFGRILSAQPGLRSALTDPAAPVESRTGLVRDLLGDRARPTTTRLVSEVVAHPRGRTLDGALADLAELAAASRRRMLAQVRTAHPLTGEQEQRLQRVLTRIYDRDVELQVAVDDSLVGGLTVHVGDEVIDGTLAARLEQARRQLAG